MSEDAPLGAGRARQLTMPFGQMERDKLAAFNVWIAPISLKKSALLRA